MKNTYTFKQYSWLVNLLLRAKRMSLENIQQRWIDDDLNDRKPLSRTTFYRLRQAIDDLFGIHIQCDTNDGFQYHISNPEVLKNHSTENWMFQTLTVNNILADSLSIKDRLVLEEIPEGTGHIPIIIKAIKTNHQLIMTHKSFLASEAKTMVIEPYCLKLFRQRWYLLVKYAPNFDDLRIYALDRIINLEETDFPFNIDPNFHAEEYFRHYFGVFIGKDPKPTRIVLRAYGKMIPLLRTLPKHHSQKEITTTNDYSDFEYFMAPTFDLRQEILREGSELEVIEPDFFRKELFEETEKAYSNYCHPPKL